MMFAITFEGPWAVGIVRRAAPSVGQETQITLYKTLLFPYFDNCGTAWRSGITQCNLMKLHEYSELCHENCTQMW